ncbi:MAG: hypothetical protein H6822_33350 [Planctomycetaceae bacterium]|nr:hypothetical protein [Planctomycetales bacterium]MCB9927074.1 hypothetical protein [Planctomycetaceae bacterium]
MSNPYEAPLGEIPMETGGGPLPPPQEPGMVGQVRIVSILMMIQGALDLLAGLGLIGMGFFMAFAMQEAFANNPQAQQGNGPPPETVVNMVSWIYGGLGAVVGSIGMLNLFAGYRNWKYKARTLGIISLVSGLGTIFSCYCAPTSLALCIYGLIVYLNASVASAFRMGEDGYTADEIAMTFSPLRQGQSPFK